MSIVMNRRRPRLREARHHVDRSVRRAAGAVHGGVRRVPLPAPVRRWAYQRLPWRPGTTTVPIERVLLGGQNRLSATQFADALGDPLWASTSVVDGPHAALLCDAREWSLSDAEILASDYGRMARACVASSGEFFSARDDAGIVEVARRFIDLAWLDRTDDRRLPHQSAPGQPVLLAPVRGSDCFQVVDGHHRLAAAWVAGERFVTARVKRFAVSTPLQDILDAMSWIGGERELYQPVAAPELVQSWVTVRRCTDRLAAMRRVIEGLGLEPRAASYLDVASCYGWFVARMGEQGHPAEGVERDPLGARLANLAYGVDPAAITTSDAVDFLEAAERRWDVVSCFSLLHHFVLGRGKVGPEELVHLLDRVTGRVLFIDTGQEHEAWFADSLAGWDTARVARFLTEHGTFDRVVDLGPDRDAVPPYQDNYGRHLFACIRD